MWPFKKPTIESLKKKQSVIIDKVLGLHAECVRATERFERWECKSFFRGYELSRQNQVRLKAREKADEKRAEEICLRIERIPKRLLSDIAVDFYERQTRTEDRKWKDAPHD